MSKDNQAFDIDEVNPSVDIKMVGNRLNTFIFSEAKEMRMT